MINLPEFTDEQKAGHAEIRKELEKVQEQYRTLLEKSYGNDPKQTKEQIEQIEKEQQEVRNRMTELRSKLPVEHDRHRGIWLFQRNKI